MGNESEKQMVYVTFLQPLLWFMPPCPYLVKTLKKIFFSGIKKLMTLKVGM